MSRQSERKYPIIFARVPVLLLEELDRRVEQRQDEHPGSHVTRADIIRELILVGLEATTAAPTPRTKKSVSR
jgi:hypothetical protein